jgi:hypothetical protein
VRRIGTQSWQIGIRSDQIIDCALWIRAAERLAVRPDPLVPGPLDLDHPPAPISAADDTLAEQWLGWWHSLVAPGRSALAGAALEPAHGSPDPLGLAPYPALAALVTRRWTQVLEWERGARTPPQIPPPSTINEVVRDVQTAAGRPIRPFKLEFVLLPVRDDVIREVTPERYLVPARVYDTPQWSEWLRDLVTRIGL